MSTTTASASKAKLAIAVLAFGVIGWLAFVLGAWNQNLVLVIISLAFPLALRAFRGKKMINIADDLELLVFGILLWNHMVAVIIILFILKVLVSKLRK
jgi:hypothetical protein